MVFTFALLDLRAPNVKGFLHTSKQENRLRVHECSPVIHSDLIDSSWPVTIKKHLHLYTCTVKNMCIHFNCKICKKLNNIPVYQILYNLCNTIQISPLFYRGKKNLSSKHPNIFSTLNKFPIM